jgi:hypothetical protein
MRYDVTLTAITGGNGGFVSFASAEAVHYAFFLDAPVAFAVQDGSGATVPIEESATSSPECSDIRGRHVVDLGVGTFFLSLGPATESEVSIVIEESGGH